MNVNNPKCYMSMPYDMMRYDTIYTVSGKNMPLYFYLQLCQMLTDFPHSFADRLSSKFVAKRVIIKYPTTPQRRRYTTLWNVNFRKKHHQTSNRNMYRN